MTMLQFGRCLQWIDTYRYMCHHMANFCMTDQKCAFEAVVVLFASIYFTLARTRRYQGSRWGVKTFNSCTLQNLAQVMPSSLSNLSIHFNLCTALAASPHCPACGRSGSGTFMGTSLTPTGLLGLDAKCKGGGQVLLVMPP